MGSRQREVTASLLLAARNKMYSKAKLPNAGNIQSAKRKLPFLSHKNA